MAYATPLSVAVVNETGAPLREIDASIPAFETAGTMACRPLAPAPAAMVKLRVLPAQLKAAEGRGIAAVEPGEHLAAGDDRHAARLG